MKYTNHVSTRYAAMRVVLCDGAEKYRTRHEVCFHNSTRGTAGAMLLDEASPGAWLPMLSVALFVSSVLNLYVLAHVQGRHGALANWRRVLLVISHPDDEAMFFGPTLESLKKTTNVITTTKVFCICLSNGNASGLGQTRAKELKKSTLEVFKLDGCVIADSEDLQDGMENAWPLEEIANVVHECVQHYSPDVILTFDERGVSKHPNHVQTHRGVMRFIVEAKLGAIPNAEYTEENVPEVWVLETTPFYRTFMGAMDYWASVITTTTRKKKGSKNTSNESSNSNSSSLAAGASSTSSSSVMFCSRNPSLVLEAMRTHATQWVWYRKLYVAFSRYSLLNTLRRMDVGPPPSQQEK